MLKELQVQNYALIDNLRVNFPGSMTVITGETGAGKSILIGALGLIMGKRSDSSVLFDKKRKCIVEAIFDVRHYRLKEFFTANDLDYFDYTTLRRELNPEGKSRAFINDTPVTLQLLKSLAEKLIDIHSQHETLMLGENDFRFQVLDSFSETGEVLEKYRKVYYDFKRKNSRLAELKSELQLAIRDRDYYQFQFNDLESADLVQLDLSELKRQAESLENAEFIKGNLSFAAGALGEGEKNILNTTVQIKSLLSQIKKFSSEYLEYESRIASLIVEMKDLERDLSLASEKIEFNNSKLDDLNEKIETVQRLFKKHGVNEVGDLIILKEDISKKINSTENLEQEILILEKEILFDQKTARGLAEVLSQKRIISATLLSEGIQQLLSKLNMPNARFQIEFQPSADLNDYGMDEIKFLFSANKGGDFKELHKVASGGELSRVMLSVKSVIAKHTALPTILFDEIDTGVSGEVGACIGNILESMSKKMQVISITHLPQIASRGNHHLMVYKNELPTKTVSLIKELNKTERVEEVAKMLSSGKPTPISIKNARELIGQN